MCTVFKDMDRSLRIIGSRCCKTAEGVDTNMCMHACMYDWMDGWMDVFMHFLLFRTTIEVLNVDCKFKLVF
jgi:hypothetical protein